MTWLFVLLLWTACSVLAAPVVGRFLAAEGRPPAERRPVDALPEPRAAVPLS